jgi:hypothetical protein
MEQETKPSILPSFTFDQFTKNPVGAIAIICLMAVSWLYVDLRGTYKEQIAISNQKIEKLEYKIDQLQIQLKKSDSTLSAAITELRIINESKPKNNI